MTEPQDAKESTGRSPDAASNPSANEPSPPGDDDPRAVATVRSSFRSKPTVWIPFLVAGCLLWLVDGRRERDSLPIQPPGSESTLDGSFSLYPTGTTETGRSLDALVDLPLEVLAYGVGLELLVIGAVATAGWLTMTRVSETSVRPRRFVVYAGVVSLLSLLENSGSAIDLTLSVRSLPVAVVAFAGAAFVTVRLFFLPVAILRAEPLRAAPRESWRRSRGQGVTLVALIVVIVLASGWLAALPSVGVVLSVTIVGTVHAVSVVALYDRRRTSSSR